MARKASTKVQEASPAKITASPSSRKRKRTDAPTTKSGEKSIIDLTQSPSPSAKKGKKAPSKVVEKRLRQFRHAGTGKFREKLYRAQTQRMFVIERTPGGNMDCPEETVSMAGSTGNVYRVCICRLPKCSCPDNRKGNQCKHIVYVLHFVLKAPEHLQYQLAFLSTELQEIFKNAPSPIASAKTSDESEGSGAKRRPIDGDCPICFTAFDPGKEEIIYCKAACGNNVHTECFESWARSQAGREVRCVYCRSEWQGDEEQILRIIKDKMKRNERDDVDGEGYVNVASELGLSGARDYSSYHQPWVRMQGFGW